MSRQSMPLRDALEILIDHRGKTPKKLGGDWTTSGHRVISALNVKGSRIDENDHHYISEEIYDRWMKVPLLKGDVLLTSEAPTGEVAFIDSDRDWALGQRLFGLRGKPGLLDGRYLYYALRGGELRHDLMSRTTGTTVQGIRQSELVKVEINLPPVEEQRQVAATLGALDDKIQSNRRLIGLIPRLVRSRVDACLAEGASEARVSSLARFVNGGAYTKGATGAGRMVIRIAELNSGPGGSTVYNELDVPVDKTAHAGDVLMSWSGSLGVYRWARDEAIINQHIFKVIPTGYPAWLVFDRLDAVIDVFRGYAADKATTMGHIKRGDLDTTRVQLPREEALRGLDVTLGPLWNRLLIAEQEVLRLEALRDALLPELLSGRIRVPEAQGVMA